MTLPASSLEQRRVRWQHACRVVPTRYPAVLLYDHVADAADFDALVALEAMSNERVRDEVAERLPLFGFYRPPPDAFPAGNERGRDAPADAAVHGGHRRQAA